MNECKLYSTFSAVITIEGNDDENGVFSFSSTSLEVAVEESEIGLCL